jgi:hypothetical protein
MTEKTDLLPELDFIDDDVIIDDNAEKAHVEKTEEVVETEELEEKPDVRVKEGADPNVLAAYKFYVDSGIVASGEEEFGGTPEDLQEVLLNTIDERTEGAIESMIAPLPPVGKAIIAMALEKGDKLSVKDIQNLLEEVSIPELGEEDMKDVNSAHKYMLSVFKKQGYSSDDAEDMVDVLKDKGKLSQQATLEIKKEIAFKQSKAQQVVEGSKESRQQKKLTEEEFRKSFSEAITSTKWRKDKVDKVVGSFFEGKFRESMNHALYENPKALVQLIDFMNHYDAKKGEFDMEAYKKEAFSPTVKKVAEKIKTNYWNTPSSSVKKESGSQEEYVFID